MAAEEELAQLRALDPLTGAGTYSQLKASLDSELSLIYYRGRRNLEDRVQRIRSPFSVASKVMPRVAHTLFSAGRPQGPSTITVALQSAHRPRFRSLPSFRRNDSKNIHIFATSTTPLPLFRAIVPIVSLHPRFVAVSTRREYG
jgi:hypothetical protein